MNTTYSYEELKADLSEQILNAPESTKASNASLTVSCDEVCPEMILDSMGNSLAEHTSSSGSGK